MSTGKTKITIAFDLYGTILQTDSITDALATHLYRLGNTTNQAQAQARARAQAQAISARWRRYQLEYTWRMTAMGAYEPFDSITRAALRHAAAEEPGLDRLPDAVVDSLMRSYDSLGVFPDVVRALEALRGRPGGRGGGDGSSSGGGGGGGGGGVGGPGGEVRRAEEGVDVDVDVDVEAVVFSNGTRAMLGNSIDSSPGLRPFRDDDHPHHHGDDHDHDHDRGRDAGSGPFVRLITVDDARTYKPSPLSYRHLRAEAGGGRGGEGEALVWLVSANPFDVVGARAAGLPAAWVDRAGTGWVDGLGDVIFGVGGSGGDGGDDDGDDDVGGSRARPTIVAGGVDEAVGEILRRGIW